MSITPCSHCKVTRVALGKGGEALIIAPARPVGPVDLTSSIKRIAWAYGCSKKDSQEEYDLLDLLLRKIEAEHEVPQPDEAEESTL